MIFALIIERTQLVSYFCFWSFLILRKTWSMEIFSVDYGIDLTRTENDDKCHDRCAHKTRTLQNISVYRLHMTCGQILCPDLVCIFRREIYSVDMIRLCNTQCDHTHTHTVVGHMCTNRVRRSRMSILIVTNTGCNVCIMDATYVCAFVIVSPLATHTIMSAQKCIFGMFVSFSRERALRSTFFVKRCFVSFVMHFVVCVVVIDN